MMGVLTAFSTALAAPARAEEPLTGPPTETEGKPLSPPAPPVDSTGPKLLGLNFTAGVALVDLGPLNDRLRRAGYPNKLPLAFPLIGGQGFGLFSKFLIGGSGTGFLSRTVDMPGGEVDASGAWGTFDFGYQLLRVNGFLVAPILSLGGYGMTVNVRSKADTSFNNALENPTRSTTLTSKGVLGGVSVLADLIAIGRGSDLPHARSGWSLGLRLGALYGIPYRDWHADGVKASGGPKFGLRGGYLALSLGAGTW
jgi:hypothetical protein